MRAGTLAVYTGSSPLTRGKRLFRLDRLDRRRLIPAHAGKTLLNRVPLNALSAHPRSRGENCGPHARRHDPRGSSPLTRGKLGQRNRVDPEARLIPAHAGKTVSGRVGPCLTKAHPRSRGENRWRRASPRRSEGSSPLTRGKHGHRLQHQNRRRLIPAHAGKTVDAAVAELMDRAHPRSRGENPRDKSLIALLAGSSPLTRGKPGVEMGDHSAYRLIPAHAGKTVSGRVGPCLTKAHPRSRGENTMRIPSDAENAGSSPLTRGKLHAPHQRRRSLWLIPAHAGKTIRRP